MNAHPLPQVNLSKKRQRSEEEVPEEEVPDIEDHGMDVDGADAYGDVDGEEEIDIPTPDHDDSQASPGPRRSARNKEGDSSGKGTPQSQGTSFMSFGV
jgi:hypothetical protein